MPSSTPLRPASVPVRKKAKARTRLTGTALAAVADGIAAHCVGPTTKHAAAEQEVAHEHHGEEDEDDDRHDPEDSTGEERLRLGIVAVHDHPADEDLGDTEHDGAASECCDDRVETGVTDEPAIDRPRDRRGENADECCRQGADAGFKSEHQQAADRDGRRHREVCETSRDEHEGHTDDDDADDRHVDEHIREVLNGQEAVAHERSRNERREDARGSPSRAP